MSTLQPVHVRCLASLHAYQRERNQPTSLEITVPERGVEAQSLASDLGLPAETIEGVFLNYTIAGVDAIVRPGDRVAFVPSGTPASHPSFFGPFVTRE